MRGIKFSIPALAAAATLSALAAPAQSAVILNVGWNGDVCSKASCFNDDGVFKQTWSAKDAQGLQTIAKFLLARGVLGSLDGKTFKISFTVGDQEIGSWGSYNMGGIGGDELNFDGLDFDWNPEDGDLVLTLAFKDVARKGVGGGGGGGGGSGVGGSTLANDLGGGSDGGLPGGSGMVAEDGWGGDVDTNPALGGLGDTGDEPGGLGLDVSGAPEPTSWALMIMGFGAAGVSLRQRRRILARA